MVPTEVVGFVVDLPAEADFAADLPAEAVFLVDLPAAAAAFVVGLPVAELQAVIVAAAETEDPVAAVPAAVLIPAVS